MKLIGRHRIAVLRGINVEIDNWVSVWVVELRNNNWFNSVELLHSFPKAEIVHDSLFLFPIVSSDYSIKVFFCFKKGIAVVSEVIKNQEIL